eukprot:scaffold50486_cov76-Phaeocystis_antarctica.AAC.6
MADMTSGLAKTGLRNGSRACTTGVRVGTGDDNGTNVGETMSPRRVFVIIMNGISTGSALPSGFDGSARRVGARCCARRVSQFVCKPR